MGRQEESELRTETDRELQTGDVTNSDLHTQIQNAIRRIEESEVPLEGTYVKYSSEPFRCLPVMTLLVQGQMMEFLVDSGATVSVLTENSLSVSPKLSGRSTESIAASGTLTKEWFRVPLTCNDSVEGIVKHSFIFSTCCPMNLLGRDLMCKLGICLISTPEGITL